MRSRYQRWQSMCIEFPNLKALYLDQRQEGGFMKGFVLINDRSDHLVAAKKLPDAHCFLVQSVRTLFSSAIQQTVGEPKRKQFVSFRHHGVMKSDCSLIFLCSPFHFFF